MDAAFTHPGVASPVVGFALYAGAAPAASAVLEVLREEFGDAVTSRLLEVEGKGAVDTVIVAAEGVTVLCTPVDAPLPADEVLRACHPVWWREARDAVADHHSHLIITALHAGAAPEPRTQSLRESTMFSVVAANAAALPGAVAVYAGSAGLAVPAEAYRRTVDASIEAEELPVELWASVWLIPEADETHSAYTLGLDAFGHADLVVEHSRRHPSDLYHLLISLAAHVIATGAQFQPGNTVGTSAEEQLPLRARHSGIHNRMVLEVGDNLG